MLFGAGDIKKRVTLTSENFFQRCEMWWRYKCECDTTIDIITVLRDMMRSGLFFPSARWITPTQGKGMDKNRARVMFKMVRDYERVGYGDVNVIFFDDTHADRYYRDDTEDILRRYGDWPPEPRSQPPPPPGAPGAAQQAQQQTQSVSPETVPENMDPTAAAAPCPTAAHASSPMAHDFGSPAPSPKTPAYSRVTNATLGAGGPIRRASSADPSRTPYQNIQAYLAQSRARVPPRPTSRLTHHPGQYVDTENVDDHQDVEMLV